MNMDVLAALTARHTLEKEAALPALIAPVLAAGAKALPWLGRAAMSLGSKALPAAKTVGSKSLELGKASLPYLGMGAAMEGGSAAIRGLSGGGGEAPPQGPSGPRGPGATHGMLGFPQQEGPKGPPDFGDRHSRDRADPDTGNGGSQSSGTGFKLANAADYAAFISFRKQALDVGGLIQGAYSGAQEAGEAVGHGADVAGRMAGRGVDYAGKGLATAGKGVRRVGGMIHKNPRTALAMAAAPALAYGAYRGGKALFGGKDEEKQSADIGGFVDRLGQFGGENVQSIGHSVMPTAALAAGGKKLNETGMGMGNRAAGRAMAKGLDPLAAQSSMAGQFGTQRGMDLLQGRMLQGQNEAIGGMSGLDKVKGRAGQGIAAAGRFISKHPRSAVGAAAVAAPALAYGAYRGGKALFGGSKKDEEKTSAMLLGNNLLDVMAFTMEQAEKKAGLLSPFEPALVKQGEEGGISQLYNRLLGRNQRPGMDVGAGAPDIGAEAPEPPARRSTGLGKAYDSFLGRDQAGDTDRRGRTFTPMTPEEVEQAQQPRQYKVHPVHTDWAWDPAQHDWVHRNQLGPGPIPMVHYVKPPELRGAGPDGGRITPKPKPAPGATPTTPAPGGGGPPGVGKGPGDWTPPPPPGPPGVGKPDPGAPAAPPAAGGAPGAPQAPPGYMPGYDEPPGTPPAAPKPPANYMPGYDEPPAPPAGGAPPPEAAPMPREVPPAGGVQVGTATTPGHGAGAAPPTPAPTALPKPTIKPTGGFNVGGKKTIPMGV